MLQKISKCEVKAWLCWNLIILPSLRFYVKSNFGVFKWSKNVVMGNFRGSEFGFLANLSNFQVPNLSKFKDQRLWNCYTWQFWTVWICQNLISRKIWVAVKWSNFNKVSLNFTFWKFLEHSAWVRIRAWSKIIFFPFVSAPKNRVVLSNMPIIEETKDEEDSEKYR